MAAPVISRLVLTDDDGTGLTGTPLNNALFQDLQNRIDTLSAAIVAQMPTAATGMVTTATLAANLNTLATSRIQTLVNYNGGIGIDMSAYDVCVINDQGYPIVLVAPVSTGAGGIIAHDEASLVYRIRDNGIAQAITWSGNWAVPMAGIPMPTATVPGATLHIALRFSTRVGAWYCVAITTDNSGTLLERIGDLDLDIAKPQ